MMIWSMLQVLSQENEKENNNKKELQIMDSICGMREVFFLGGFRDSRKEGCKRECSFHWEWNREYPRLPVLPGPLYDVITLPSLMVLF